MSFNAGAITSTLGLDVSPFAQGMLQAQGIANVFPQMVQNFLANPILGVIGVLSDLGGSLKAAFTNATNAADDMNDMAVAVGVAVEKLTALGAVASMSGGSVESTADAFKFLGKSVAEAMKGGDAADVFEDLGIALRDATGEARPLQDVMLDVADALKYAPSAAQRTALAMDLLGKSGVDMIPTLIQGSDALREQIAQMERYGAAVTSDSAKSADGWNDAFGEISLAMQGIQNSFAAEIRSALLPFLESVVGWVRQYQPVIRAFIGDVLDGVSWLAANIAGPMVRGAFGMFQTLLTSMVGAFNSVVAGMKWVGDSLGGMVSRFVPVQTILSSVKNAFTAVNDFVSNTVLGTFSSALQWALGQVRTSAAVFVDGWLWMGEQIAAIKPYVEVAWEILKDQAAWMLNEGKTAVELTYAAAWTKLGNAISAIKPYVEIAWEILKQQADWMWNKGKAAIEMGMIVAWFKLRDAIAGIAPYVEVAWEILKQQAAWMWKEGVTAVELGLAAAWLKLGNAFTSVMPAIDVVWIKMKEFFGWIMDTVQPLLNWIADKLGKVVGGMQAAASIVFGGGNSGGGSSGGGASIGMNGSGAAGVIRDVAAQTTGGLSQSASVGMNGASNLSVTARLEEKMVDERELARALKDELMPSVKSHLKTELDAIRAQLRAADYGSRARGGL